MEMKFRRDNRIVGRALIDYTKTTASVRVNSVINKKAYLSGGYPLPLFNQMWESAHGDDLNKNASIAIINDYALEVTYELLHKEFKNITIIATHDNIYHTVNDLMKYFYELPIEINVMKLEEVVMGKPEFDLIIANPPFSVGNDITRAIINNVSFGTYVNLMPLSKYKKNNLYRYVTKKVNATKWIEAVEEEDVKTSPDICLMSNSSNGLPYDEFELEFYYDSRLYKFFKENLTREKCYSEHIYICAPNKFHLLDSKTSFAVGIYTPCDKVHGIKKLEQKFNTLKAVEKFITTEKKSVARDSSEEYIWNFIKPDCNVEQCFAPCANKAINQIFTIFSSEIEKDNFVKWWYSAERNGNPTKSGLTSILLAGLNKPTGCPFEAAIPNVDWTREWTDEEILADYGYNETEIKDILALGKFDLNNHGLGDYQ